MTFDGRRCRLTCSFPRACARRRTATAADVVDGRPPALTGSGGGVGVPGVDVELGVVVTMIVVASWWRWWWRRGGGGGESWVAAATTERQRCGRGGNCVGRGSRCWLVEAEMMLWMVAACLLCLKNLVRAKKPADRFGKVGTQVCIKEQEANL